MKILRKYNLSITKLFSLLIILITSSLLGCSLKETKAPTIDLGDGNYLMPGARNKDGCTEYHLGNDKNLPTIQMIYYVDKNMNYSGNYDKNNCF